MQVYYWYDIIGFGFQLQVIEIIAPVPSILQTAEEVKEIDITQQTTAWAVAVGWQLAP